MKSNIIQKRARPSAFDDCPEFYLNDNRINRKFNPVTKEVLETKLSVLLPQWQVKNKNILDLGSCLGAAGQWALFHGASSYTGIETQKGYATQSGELLKPWKTKARIYQRDIRKFLRETDDEAYDVILMAGVIYLFIDPKNIIDEMCRVAKQAVVIETNYPQSIRKGCMPSHALITEYVYEQEVNLDDGNDSLLGISATTSLRAMDLMFGLNSFGKKEPTLTFPRNKHMLNYAMDEGNKFKIPLRLAVRYSRNDLIKMNTLEESLPEKNGFRRSWKHDPISINRTLERDKIHQELNRKIGSWKFNDTIAKHFSTIAEREIPDYRRVIEKTVHIINKANFDNPKIIDIGSATGLTLQSLYKSGYKNIYGVDNSQEMLARSFKKATLIHSDVFPMDHAPFDIIIANWVLHFVDNRVEYLQKIKAALNNNGIFILTEKLTSSLLAHSLYDDFKRDNGMTNDEIEMKRNQLKGVLNPCSLMWYLNSLKSIGFKSIDIINANSVFVTFLIQHDEVNLSDQGELECG